MFRSMVALLVAALVAGFQTAPSHAQTVCGDRAKILERLEKVHAEMPRAIGLTADGAVLEILSSPTGSWTILVTFPNRSTCLLAAGEAWESLPILASGQPA